MKGFIKQIFILGAIVVAILVAGAITEVSLKRQCETAPIDSPNCPSGANN